MIATTHENKLFSVPQLFKENRLFDVIANAQNFGFQKDFK